MADQRDKIEEAAFKLYLSNLLIEAREREGITKQGDIAKRLGVSQATVSGYESGDYFINTRTLKDYADALGLDIKISFVKKEN